MKSAFFSFLALFGAFAAGAATPFFLATGEDAYGVAASLALVVACLALGAALHCQYAELSRTMIRDLRSIEALLDDREFDHG